MLPRPLHPVAWWTWAIGMGVAASRTTNPLVLGLIVAVVAWVVAARRSNATWARGIAGYLYLGLAAIAIRVVFRMLFDASDGGHVLFTLPEIPLPKAAAGIQIGGPVSLEGILAALYDGLRLATLVLCVGAANLLADPKRLLKAVPGALHEIGVAVTVTLSVAPQLVESVARVRAARRLRGGPTGWTGLLHQVGIPVLADALDRSLLLAASMDARGYGRTSAVAPRLRRATGILVLTGLVGACVGTYGLLDGTAPRYLGLPVLGIGLALGAAGFLMGNRRVHRSRYRPDPWRVPEWTVAAIGVAVAALFVALSSVDPSKLNPSLQPLQWPDLPPRIVAAVLLGSLPAWLAPAQPGTDAPRAVVGLVAT